MRNKVFGIAVLGASVGVDHISYKEHVTPPLKSTEKGFLPSVQGWLKAPIDDMIDVEASLSLAISSLKYDGSTQDGDPSTHTDSHFFVNLEGLAVVWPTPHFGFYAGIQERSWLRGVKTYNELYQMWILPVGVRTQLDLDPMFNVGVDISVRWLPFGFMRLYTSQMDSSLDDINLPLGSSCGWRVALPFRFHSNEKLTWVLTPSYQLLRIGAGSGEYTPITSNGEQVYEDGKALGAREPASDTHEWAVNLGLEW